MVGARSRRAYLLRYGAMLLAVAVAFCGGLGLAALVIVGGPFSRQIAHASLTTGLDANSAPVDSVMTFPVDAPAIYCVADAEPSDMRLVAAWYQDEAPLPALKYEVDTSGVVRNGRHIWTLRPKAGQTFAPGKYLVVLSWQYGMGGRPKTLEFTVGQAP